ncbi:MAG: toll/interleukin-1 receptor domain-containing protein [Candidatus Acidiferrales bacterium]
MAHDVFISYAAEDRNVAIATCATLENHGIRCWMAPRDVTPGVPYGEAIIDAIQGSRIMILVFSEKANSSPHIPKEIERAVSRGISVIPLRIEDVVPGKALDYFIGNVHWLDALTRPIENHLEVLARNVNTLLGKETAVAEKKSGGPVTPHLSAVIRASKLAEYTTDGKKRAKPWALYAVLGAAVVLIAILSVMLFMKKGTRAPHYELADTLSGHSGGVAAVAFSYDGRWLASGSADETIKLWNVATRKEERTLKGHTEAVLCVAFSPDGKWLASGSRDKSVKLWDLSGGRVVRTLSGHSAQVNAVAFSPDGKWVASASDDKKIRLWDTNTGRSVRLLEGHSDGVNSIAFSTDGQLLASSSDDKTVKIWDPNTGKELKTLTGHDGNVNVVAFNPDGTRIASGSDDKTARIWEVSSGQAVETLSDNFGGISSLSFSPSGHWIATGGGGVALRIWDATTGKDVESLMGHSSAIHGVAYSHDGRLIASGSEDETIKLWKIVVK